MAFRTPLAWHQLCYKKVRLFVAIAGIAFANILMFMQIGFENSLYDSAVSIHQILNGDIFLISSKYTWMQGRQVFPRIRIYEALACASVACAEPVFVSNVMLTNLETRHAYVIVGLAFTPRRGIITVPGIDRIVDRLKRSGDIFFDEHSKPRYGPIVERYKAGLSSPIELNGHRVEIAGLFDIGPSFGSDGTFMMSADDYVHIDPTARMGLVTFGLIQLKPGADPVAVRRQLDDILPGDVQVLTKPEFIEAEKNYWRTHTPIGFLFRFGLIMGFIVGTVIVYQILFTDVSDHLAEYATLKAMGYSNLTLTGVIAQEAIILAFLGFIPGYFASLGLYAFTRAITKLPLEITLGRSVFVLVMTIVMCTISGAIAMRKLQTADPAEIF